jgi:hypothetical protein
MKLHREIKHVDTSYFTKNAHGSWWAGDRKPGYEDLAILVEKSSFGVELELLYSVEDFRVCMMKYSDGWYIMGTYTREFNATHGVKPPEIGPFDNTDQAMVQIILTGKPAGYLARKIASFNDDYQREFNYLDGLRDLVKKQIVTHDSVQFECWERLYLLDKMRPGKFLAIYD